MDALFEITCDRMNTGHVVLLFNGCQRQVQGCFGDQFVLLAHGIDGQRQEVQQLCVTKGGQAQGRALGRVLQQCVRF